MDKSLVISRQSPVQTRANRRSPFGNLIQKLRSKGLLRRKNCKNCKNREFHQGEDSEDSANSSDSVVQFCVGVVVVVTFQVSSCQFTVSISIQTQCGKVGSNFSNGKGTIRRKRRLKPPSEGRKGAKAHWKNGKVGNFSRRGCRRQDCQNGSFKIQVSSGKIKTV